jgi:glycosyltransferase involved in cell wall biosynthesis
MKNCRQNVFESVAFSLRSIIGRRRKLFFNNVTTFVTPAKFIKNCLVEAGYSENKFTIIPNVLSMPDSIADPAKGKYIAYAGRISSEKGIDTLINSSMLTGLPVRIAGDFTPMSEVAHNAPSNVKFVGLLDRCQVNQFYRNARFVVVPSLCLDVHPGVIAEAMSHSLPVLASRIGGIPEMVADKKTGLLFEPGNSNSLASKMKFLWENIELCCQMGKAGRDKAINEYTKDIFHDKILDVYQKAIKLNN